MNKSIDYEALSSLKNILLTFQITMEKLLSMFLYRKGSIPEIEKALSNINNQINSELLRTPSYDKKKVNQFIEIYQRIGYINESFMSIVLAIQAKNDEKVLFSDKAVKEIETLFQNLISMLKNIVDYLGTRNSILLNHLIEDQARYEASCQHFSNEHEDRLAKGICLPRSSTIYLKISDKMCNISWDLISVVNIIGKL
ncbi:hypothetical protein [Desulfotomaculum copahuensis]|uniref:PhoU domain-containing protein n=1 Tax=Desulfotomaculum copahuensis TaxID=1838280 RepID=A0A1B7LDR4_9FIRM|nr:hypothetical protein [Desulfotomaculum copahuensis]OAT81230.1 hypothetical protein A6M21_00050 [Desulfotomaculum copahuensis]